MPKVLLVEDDKGLAANIMQWLKLNNYNVEHTADGGEASHFLKVSSYDVLILDWELPGKTGVQICREFRTAGGTTPVVFLTGRDQVAEKVEALDAGGDDYVTKPFHMAELGARLRSLLRRDNVSPSNRISVETPGGVLELDRTTHEVFLSGNKVRLFPKEFSLLELFMTHQDRVFSIDDLLRGAWSIDSDATEETVRTYVKTLRRKIAPPDAPSPVKTIHGVGYKFSLKD